MFSIVFAGLFFTLMILVSSIGVNHVFGDSVISTISVEKFPQAIEFNPANNNIYVANLVSNSVSIIDSISNDISETLNVNNVPLALKYNPSNNSTYVTGTLTGTEGLVTLIH